MKDRVILHCDCNSFFASVETVLDPSLKNVPLAVCGSQEERHGIVLAKNELAKKYNIQTAETVYSAKKKCPSLVIVSPHSDQYKIFSKKVNKIYERYTDMIEPFGIDESWLDVTASKKIFGDGYTIAERIRKEVREEIGITVSIGVSFNKVFAKLGSDYKKPDAITVIDSSNFTKIVYPLPVGDLLFVGKKTVDVLLSMGIRTIGDLANTSLMLLETKFGKNAHTLYSYARGLDDSEVASGIDDEVKSVGNGYTFKHDLVGREECRVGIEYLSEEVAARLRNKRMKCSTVQLTIKDQYLKCIQRQRPLKAPTDISREIADCAYSILIDEWSEYRPIRMLTVTGINLVEVKSLAEQITMFDDTTDMREKNHKREEAVDKIRQKFGSTSILSGSIISTDIGTFNKNE